MNVTRLTKFVIILALVMGAAPAGAGPLDCGGLIMPVTDMRAGGRGYTRHHPGVDLMAPYGAPIRAAAAAASVPACPPPMTITSKSNVLISLSPDLKKMFHVKHFSEVLIIHLNVVYSNHPLLANAEPAEDEVQYIIDGDFSSDFANGARRQP